MTTLEVLMKAEQSLLDESIPYNYQSFTDCTCGHILRAVEGKPGYAGSSELREHPEYAEVIKEVALALGSTTRVDVQAIWDVSDHAGGKSRSRQDALNTIRTAMLALQPPGSQSIDDVIVELEKEYEPT